MDKYILVDQFLGMGHDDVAVIEARNSEDAYDIASEDYADAIPFNVDEAMTVAENLINFIAEYRQANDKVKRNLAYYREEIGNDIYDNLLDVDLQKANKKYNEG